MLVNLPLDSQSSLFVEDPFEHLNCASQTALIVGKPPQRPKNSHSSLEASLPDDHTVPGHHFSSESLTHVEYVVKDDETHRLCV